MADTPDPSSPQGRRPGMHGTVIAAVIALTVGISGLFMGMRQTDRAADERIVEHSSTMPAADTATGDESRIPRAIDYSRLHEGTLRPNTGWENSLSKLDRPKPELARFAQLNADDQELVRLRRASHRQYDGAPPVAPHPLDQMSASTCLECHGQPTTISGVSVPQMSHPFHSNCLQCHVSGNGPTSTWRTRPVSLAAGNGFAGKPAPGFGSRAYIGAPPVIPHTTWMRQNCITCHGPSGTSPFRTSHPDRQNCLQCHATNAFADQSPAMALTGVGLGSNLLPPPLPAPLP